MSFFCTPFTRSCPYPNSNAEYEGNTAFSHCVIICAHFTRSCLYPTSKTKYKGKTVCPCCVTTHTPTSVCHIEGPGETKRREVVLDPVVIPEEIMSREVELDPQVSPEEIMSREVELGCESWTFFASSCYSTAVQRTLSLWLCPAQQLKQQLRCTLVAAQWRRDTALTLPSFWRRSTASSVFWVSVRCWAFTLSPPAPPPPLSCP